MRRMRLLFPQDPSTLDFDYYRELLLRAATSVLEPFGLDRTSLEGRLFGYNQTVASSLFSYRGAGVYSLDAFTAVPDRSLPSGKSEIGKHL